ncbi:MAG: transposase [Eisenbergiella sp.]
MLLRGDSGFTKPEFYEQCETDGVSYAVRLKLSELLRKLAAEIDNVLQKR